jgi:7,8-dihydro-6-hydroxymethylpterin-pyrophosphokinase
MILIALGANIPRARVARANATRCDCRVRLREGIRIRRGLAILQTPAWPDPGDPLLLTLSRGSRRQLASAALLALLQRIERILAACARRAMRRARSISISSIMTDASKAVRRCCRIRESRIAWLRSHSAARCRAGLAPSGFGPFRRGIDRGSAARVEKRQTALATSSTPANGASGRRSSPARPCRTPSPCQGRSCRCSCCG